MGNDTLFDPDEYRVDNPVGKTCRTCRWRQRWQCGGSIIQYCARIPSNRTFNGLLKIKVTNRACDLYQEEHD